MDCVRVLANRLADFHVKLWFTVILTWIFHVKAPVSGLTWKFHVECALMIILNSHDFHVKRKDCLNMEFPC